MNVQRALVLLLRMAAVLLLLALGAVVFPFSWMAAIHGWLGMGELPDRPIVGYLARSLSAMYAIHGALAWLLSLDVRRFAPVIYFQAVVTIVFGVGMLLLDLVEGMPLFWTLCEGPFVAALGIALLALIRRQACGATRTT